MSADPLPSTWRALREELDRRGWGQGTVVVDGRFGLDSGDYYRARPARGGWEWGHTERGRFEAYGWSAEEAGAVRGLRGVLVGDSLLPADPRGPWPPRGRLTLTAPQRAVHVTPQEVRAEVARRGVAGVEVTTREAPGARVGVVVRLGREVLDCGTAADELEAGTFVRHLLVDRGLLPERPADGVAGSGA